MESSHYQITGFLIQVIWLLGHFTVVTDGFLGKTVKAMHLLNFENIKYSQMKLLRRQWFLLNSYEIKYI